MIAFSGKMYIIGCYCFHGGCSAADTYACESVFNHKTTKSDQFENIHVVMLIDLRYDNSSAYVRIV